MKEKRQDHQTIPDQNDYIDLTLRVPDKGDAKAIIGLLKDVSQETPYLTMTQEAADISISQQAHLIELFEEVPTNIIIVAEVDDQIIGMANVATYGSSKQDHVAETGICLIKEYWGYGIGTHLMEEIIAFSKKVGLKVLSLEVVCENQAAISLYEKFGFIKCGTLHKRLRDGYHYYDVYVMELILS
ncbi:GNAT family N-acetyltransferase [Vaginisenegalia massiliensis]|uniref:GNAT family N-acetyltransferase n=1 Tax=Vaginisenegalia massiliensis TaxID=2058294 RepID=UPI0013DE77E3|nr:GNAT family protein [Vaginisenegalia massiliensis]